MNQETVAISFSLNGTRVQVSVSPSLTLLELLRREFLLLAAKEGCGKGECGACSVLLNDEPLNSCLKLAATMNEQDRVVTLEGLAEDKLMKNVQQAFVEEGAVQCGFCIPGMVLSTWHLLHRHPHPTPEDVREGLSGNLCRCTGYRKIEAAALKAATTGRKP